MSEAEVNVYADLVGRVYGGQVREVFSQIIAKKKDAADFTLDSVLDQARREVYRKQNEAAATSGHVCFDSDGDL